MSDNILAIPRAPARERRFDFSTTSDEELMALCAEDSDAAFRALVDRHGAHVINLIARVVRDRDRAEELSQEVFVRVFRHRRRYRATARFTTWLHTIALNIARNELRRVKRQGASMPIDPVTGMNDGYTFQLEDDGPLADETVSRGDTAALVRGAIEDLAPHHREILVLRDLQGLAYGEIADVLAIPGGTVRSRVNRARLALKKRLCELVPALETGDGSALRAAGL